MFTESELRLYELGLNHAWTLEELKDLVLLLKDPTFQADDISPGLHEKFQELIKVQAVTQALPSWCHGYDTMLT